MQDIFEVIRQYHMIEEGMHVVAGVSGGADSVCLLYVLCEYRRQVPFGLTVVHVEHGLRGEESLADARFTEELCERFGVACHVRHVQAERTARLEGLSVEEAARRERYRVFREIQEACRAQRIAVAHNQNDQAETVLWNLARGSGLKGLGGMRPVRGEIIRPLLFTGRERIEQILSEAGLPWRTDRTNLQPDYTRNRIRLSLLPQMERELNARAAEHIADAAGRLQQVQDYLEHVTDGAAERCIRQDGDSVCILLRAFSEQEPLIRRELLRRAVELCGGLRDFGRVHLEALLELAGMDCGREISLPGRLRAVRESGILRLTRAGREMPRTAAQEIVVGIPGSCQAEDCQVKTELLENTPELMRQIAEKKYTKWLSYDTIDHNILLLRTRRPGDYLIIDREGGRKMLKDYLIDRKVPRDRRDSIRLLAVGSHVLWVIGYRISEAAKVTETTERVVKIRVEEGQDEREDTDFADRTGGQ